MVQWLLVNSWLPSAAHRWVLIRLFGALVGNGADIEGDAAFASPDISEFLDDEGFLYTIRLPKNPVLLESICHLLARPVGRPPKGALRYYASFSYQAGSWTKKCRVVAKVEWHPGKLGSSVESGKGNGARAKLEAPAPRESRRKQPLPTA